MSLTQLRSEKRVRIKDEGRRTIARPLSFVTRPLLMSWSVFSRYMLLVFSAVMFIGCGGEQQSSAPTPQSNSTFLPAPTPMSTAVPINTPTSTASPTMAPTSMPTAAPTSTPAATQAATSAPSVTNRFGYPIGVSGSMPGDGFFIRHGFQAENTWYNPGDWHTGEDWYALDSAETAGALVLAVAAGEVVYAGANYPGRVVIVRHGPDLYSMYGHLDPALRVSVGQRVARGDVLGTVLRRSDDVPNHLHFEMRSFLTQPEVNGSTPRYGYRCGPNCPPGPGYWPIDAPEPPSGVGYLNPTHVINQQMFQAASSPLGEVVVATRPVSTSVTVWNLPPSDGASAEALGEIVLQPGQRYLLLEVYSAPGDTFITSAESYEIWYRIALPDERSGWIQAAVPTAFETGSDGRSSSVSFNLLPAITLVP